MAQKLLHPRNVRFQSQIDRFNLLKSIIQLNQFLKIGYGAFGVVWSVTDPRDHRRVALKKMPNVFQNLASCKRVFRELKMLSAFKHDNVCTFIVLNPQYTYDEYIFNGVRC